MSVSKIRKCSRARLFTFLKQLLLVVYFLSYLSIKVRHATERIIFALLGIFGKTTQLSR